MVDPDWGGIGPSVRSRRILRRRTGYGRQGVVQRGGALIILVGRDVFSGKDGSERHVN